jgi:hypothetical protein
VAVTYWLYYMCVRVYVCSCECKCTTVYICEVLRAFMLLSWMYVCKEKKEKKEKKERAVFGGIHGVSSAIILFVPILHLVRILWCEIGVFLCHKCLRQLTIWRTSEINAFLLQMTLRLLYWFSPPHQSQLSRLSPWICCQTLKSHYEEHCRSDRW